MRETDRDSSENRGDASPQGPSRAAYGPPALREYGAVARRTMNSSLAGMFDSVNPATMIMV